MNKVDKKYLSEDTVYKLEILEKLMEEVQNYNKEQAQAYLKNTGIYLEDGKLNLNYK